MCVSSILIAITGLATATAVDPLSSGGSWKSPSAAREGSTARDSSKSSKIFEKLGFCNIGTLKGRYTSFSNGYADVTGIFVRKEDGQPFDVLPRFIGPVATSSSTFYGGDEVEKPDDGGPGSQYATIVGQSFTQTFSRPSTVAPDSPNSKGALGPLTVFNQWNFVEIAKNCSTIKQGIVIEFISPEHLIIPAMNVFVEGNAAPDGSDVVFTRFVTDRVEAFSGDSKQVAKFAIAPDQFKDGPPEVPSSCSVGQSCRSRNSGNSCDTDRDCAFFCFPLCGMKCERVLLRKECVSVI